MVVFHQVVQSGELVLPETKSEDWLIFYRFFGFTYISYLMLKTVSPSLFSPFFDGLPGVLFHGISSL